MAGPRDDHTKWSKSERDKYHMLSLTWNLKYDTGELIYETETDSQREQTCGCQEGGGVRVWVCGWQMQTIIHRMDKQKGPTVEHRELYSTSCDEL